MQKKVVVTGVSSFVGYHLANGFAKRGWSVIATLRWPRADYQGIQAQRLQTLDSRVFLEILDITKQKETRNFIARWQPDVWLHHAGFATNYASMGYDLGQAYASNVAPLFYIYDALQGQKATGVIVTGSSMEYSDSEEVCSETDACYPTSPYGLSKLTETLAAIQLSLRTKIPTRVARLFIPFGPLDSEQKLLSMVVQNLREKRTIDLSPCTQQRDFIYIEDVVEAYLLLANNLKLGGASILNIASGQAIALRFILEIVAHQLEVPHTLLRFGARSIRPGEPMVSYGNNQRIKRLGWQPRPLAQGVQDFLKGVL